MKTLEYMAEEEIGKKTSENERQESELTVGKFKDRERQDQRTKTHLEARDVDDIYMRRRACDAKEMTAIRKPTGAPRPPRHLLLS